MDLNEISYLEGLVAQTSYFKFRPDPVSLGGVGGWKSWKTLRVERSGWNLMGRIITSPRT